MSFENLEAPYPAASLSKSGSVITPAARQNMILRPVATLGCCGCRGAILRAVLGPAVPKLRGFAQRPKDLRVPAPRLFSSERQLDEASSPPIAIPHDHALQHEQDAFQKPWFLEVEPPRHPPSPHAPALPKSPDDAPSLLEPMIKYVYEDTGLDDLSLLDLRDLDPPAALGPGLMMLFGTARSERHLHVSSGRLVRWLWRNYKVDARADGLIGPGELKTKLRRLRKRAKLMGTNGMILPGEDHGISTGWVCVNFSVSGSDSGETASFDESGRLSGFGAAQTGTAVVVQCMTESRRGELDLESLWQDVLRENLDQNSKIRGEKVDKAGLEALVASRVQLPTSTSALQWQAMRQASSQQRHFSTTARRLAQAEHHAHKTDQAQPEADAQTMHPAAQDDLRSLRRQVGEIQVKGMPLDAGTLERLILAAFEALPQSPGTAAERVALVDELLLTAHERGLPVGGKDMLIGLIESVAKSPAYGPELERAQRNLELLLVETRSALDDGQVLRLMDAYAHRRDWDRFWDAFRAPPRFRAPRSGDHYELAYRAMAATGDGRMCTEALRWVYPEMKKEQSPVRLLPRLYQSLRACILVADPAAEKLLYDPPMLNNLRVLDRRRVMRREFVPVLKEVDELWRYEISRQAAMEREGFLGRVSARPGPAG